MWSNQAHGSIPKASDPKWPVASASFLLFDFRLRLLGRNLGMHEHQGEDAVSVEAQEGSGGAEGRLDSAIGFSSEWAGQRKRRLPS